MDLRQLIEELSELWGTHAAETATVERRGWTVSIDQSASQLLFAVKASPTHNVLISHETQITRTLDEMGISEEAKLGDPEFDSRYVVRNLSDQDAAELFNPEVLDLLRKLEPFTELELASTGYRLLKHVRLGEDYDATRASADIDALVDLVEKTSRQRV
ncbi:MAG: hypothetical protein HY319_12715 [Armatimonadetes bacterium]|nr:hypothetical protein [Armatimonadota bacterium]